MVSEFVDVRRFKAIPVTPSSAAKKFESREDCWRVRWIHAPIFVAEARRSMGLDCDSNYVLMPDAAEYHGNLWTLIHKCDDDPPVDRFTPEVGERFVVPPGPFDQLYWIKYRIRWSDTVFKELRVRTRDEKTLRDQTATSSYPGIVPSSLASPGPSKPVFTREPREAGMHMKLLAPWPCQPRRSWGITATN